MPTWCQSIQLSSIPNLSNAVKARKWLHQQLMVQVRCVICVYELFLINVCFLSYLPLKWQLNRNCSAAISKSIKWTNCTQWLKTISVNSIVIVVIIFYFLFDRCAFGHRKKEQHRAVYRRNCRRTRRAPNAVEPSIVERTCALTWKHMMLSAAKWSVRWEAAGKNTPMWRHGQSISTAIIRSKWSDSIITKTNWVLTVSRIQ